MLSASVTPSYCEFLVYRDMPSLLYTFISAAPSAHMLFCPTPPIHTVFLSRANTTYLSRLTLSDISSGRPGPSVFLMYLQLTPVQEPNTNYNSPLLLLSPSQNCKQLERQLCVPVITVYPVTA